MFKLSCGRVNLYQWDSDVRLTVNDATVSEVHFKNRYSDDVYTVEVIRTDSETYANIPNILLQKSYDIIVYMFCRDDAGNYTKIAETLEVVARPKPADYVYTETELKNYHALEKRIEALEKGGAGGGGISQETDPTVPAWAKEPNKPTYSADEIGAVSKEEFNTLSGDVGKLSEDIADLKENAPTVEDVLNALPTWQGGAY